MFSIFIFIVLDVCLVFPYDAWRYLQLLVLYQTSHGIRTRGPLSRMGLGGNDDKYSISLMMQLGMTGESMEGSAA